MSVQLTYGTIYRSSDDLRPTAITRLGNEKSLDYTLKRYKEKGYLHHFSESIKKAQEALVTDLRESGVDVSGKDETHLMNVCGVRCRTEQQCCHIIDERDLCAGSAPCEHLHVLTPAEQQQRTIVACDPIQTKLRDDAMECFPRGENEIVVRVHLFYPNSLLCGNIHDLRGRLVTQKQFIPKDPRNAVGYHLYDRERRRNETSSVPYYEAMFPFTPKVKREAGFTTSAPCTAITVETVFVRDATRGRAPHYREDAAQTRTYLSYLRASELVTDDELAAHLALVPPDARAMPAFAEDRAAERLNVLVRLYLLAHDQGWTASLSAGSPHPLGRPQLPVLYRAPATEVDVADRRDPQAPALLRQALQPDAESQITRFCFRRVVSEALRRRVVARGAEAEAEEAAAHYDAVVCYMPHGDRVPALTDAQVAVLAALHPALGIRRPATRAEWGRLSQTLYQHGVALLDVLRAVGTPLVDASGAEIAADAYVPYTPDMAQDFFLVVVNRPLRDYTCVVNQRWLLDDLLRRTCDTATTRDGFRAWVRYWNTVVQLKHELEEQLGVDTVSAHLGQRLPRGARGEAAACLVSGRVTDTKGGLVFPDLGGQRFVDAAHVGHLPPGTAVVYRFWWDGRLRFQYLPTPYRWVKTLAVFLPKEQPVSNSGRTTQQSGAGKDRGAGQHGAGGARGRGGGGEGRSRGLQHTTSATATAWEPRVTLTAAVPPQLPVSRGGAAAHTGSHHPPVSYTSVVAGGSRAVPPAAAQYSGPPPPAPHPAVRQLEAPDRVGSTPAGAAATAGRGGGPHSSQTGVERPRAPSSSSAQPPSWRGRGYGRGIGQTGYGNRVSSHHSGGYW